ncbi:MAG: MotA/TolQ/ExbB proton channel family protein [Candidatus Latescibacterota bacterium]|nr:MotA/TolQ/ExbB proton channel family protein [Candidatus Latescibacterota bacterium]
MIGEMWTGMALTGKAIIAILGLLSVYSMAVVVERFVALRWATRSSRAFASEVEGITDAGAMRERATAPEYADFASLAHVVGGSLEEYDRIRAEEDDGDLIIEAVEDATMRQVDVAVINLRARLTSMATVSGVAPFLGLFGTVTGLISAFRGIAETGGGGLAAVSSGVSEALVTTVIGLFVAMPALAAYNYFMNRVEVMSIDMDNRAHGLVLGVVRPHLQLTGSRVGSNRHERRTAEGGPKVSPLPDITPIVNVALVLLIIFMIVTPMIREGVQVETPQAEAIEQLSEQDQSVVLSIQDDGSIFVNLKPVNRAILESELTLAYRGQEGKPVVIKGAENLPYRDILSVMDACKVIGAPSVDLVASRVE